MEEEVKHSSNELYPEHIRQAETGILQESSNMHESSLAL